MTVQVQKFYTAPTLIRALMREGDEHVEGSDTSSLQVLGTVGEPINPEAWKWYHRVSSPPTPHLFQVGAPVAIASMHEQY